MSIAINLGWSEFERLTKIFNEPLKLPVRQGIIYCAILFSKLPIRQSRGGYRQMSIESIYMFNIIRNLMVDNYKCL